MSELSTMIGQKILSIAIGKALESLSESTSMLVSVLESIASTLGQIAIDVDALKQAPLKLALMYYKEGNQERYREELMRAVATDDLNAQARVLYAHDLLSRGLGPQAADCFAECLTWYGPDCPLLPSAIVQAWRTSTRERAVASGTELLAVAARRTESWQSELPYSHEHRFDDGAWTIKGEHKQWPERVGVARQFAVVVWRNKGGFFSSDTFEYRAYRFADSRGEKGSVLDRFDFRESPYPQIHTITNRFLVYSDDVSKVFSVWDLYSASPIRHRMGMRRAQLAFGRPTTENVKDLPGEGALKSTDEVHDIATIGPFNVSARHWWRTYRESGSYSLPSTDSGGLIKLKIVTK